MSISIETKTVEYKVDDTVFVGFFAAPSETDKLLPGVIIVHEWWGHNQYVRERAERLAKEGFACFALDMYGQGKVADDPAEAEQLMNGTFASPEIIPNRFDAAVKALQEQPNVDGNNISAAGSCYGGAVVLNMARAGKPLASVHSFHGLLETPAPIQKGVFNGKMAVFTGEDDPMVSPEIVANFKAEMESAGVDYHLVSYPGVVHGFTNPLATERGKAYGMPLAYSAEADADSWNQMLEVLRAV